MKRPNNVTQKPIPVVPFLRFQHFLHCYNYPIIPIVQSELTFCHLMTCQMSHAGGIVLVLQLFFSQGIINLLEKVYPSLYLSVCVLVHTCILININNWLLVWVCACTRVLINLNSLLLHLIGLCKFFFFNKWFDRTYFNLLWMFW